VLVQASVLVTDNRKGTNLLQNLFTFRKLRICNGL